MGKGKKIAGKRKYTARCGVLPGRPRQADQRQVQAEMAEGYLAMADESRENADITLPAQAEVALRNDPPSSC